MLTYIQLVFIMSYFSFLDTIQCKNTAYLGRYYFRSENIEKKDRKVFR